MDDELEHLKNYKLLGCDPGKRKILTLSDSDKNKLGYSCLQRRFKCWFKLKRQKIITLDEYRTSKLCHNCEHETTNFQVRDNPKPYRKNCILVHSLLRCNKFCDRDINGSQIY